MLIDYKTENITIDVNKIYGTIGNFGGKIITTVSYIIAKHNSDVNSDDATPKYGYYII